MRVLAFRHESGEPIGTIAAAFDACGIAHDVIDPECSASVDGYDGLVVMGGPMSANDDLPFLRAEERAIEQAAARGIPVLGICLGSQLIARTLGSRVYPNPVKEIGWYEVRFTAEARADHLFGGLDSPSMVFHWHGETFDLPASAARLAYSDRCANQAYRVGESIYGIQFHPEVSPEMIACWCSEGAAEAEGPLDPHAHSMAVLSATLFGRWCTLVKERSS